MEGDAGTSRLNPPGGQERSDPGELSGGQERSDPGELSGGQERSDPGEHIPLEPDTSDQSDAQSDPLQDQPTEAQATDEVPRRPERFGRGWLVAICLALLVSTAGLGIGGYLALKSHDQSEAIAREDAMALARAKDCVTATQAPDVAAMTASQTKVIECATGDFAVQANLFASMLVEAYQAANVSVQVSDMRGAIEKHNDDGSVDVLVAVRVKVTNSQAADQEQGYRLRVNMAPADGTYKINRLDQVTS
jgi:Mce-associated membrane protein